MQIVKYKPAMLGYGSESSYKLQPLEFSSNIINRFYNSLGDLEKRRGMQQLGSTITTYNGTSGLAVIKNLHEHIDSSGNSTLYASGRYDTGGFSNVSVGAIWRYNSVSADWQAIATAGFNGRLDKDSKIFSVQMNNSLIFCNGINKNFYIDKPTDAINGAYAKLLYSTIIKGGTGTGTTNALLYDSNVSNWRTQTNVAVNDLVIVYQNPSAPNLTFSESGAIITSVGTSALDISVIGSAGTGYGFSPNGNLGTGSAYRVVDLVELNIIPIVQSPDYIIYDNIATGGQATSALAVSVTALNFSTTEIKRGDYVYNTTRGAVDIVSTVTSNIGMSNGINGQTSGDSLVFFKDALPIAAYPHVHYGRLHLIDARDPTKIRVSGPNDPEDFTTFSKTLSSNTIDYGARQPKGDILLTMNTFQRYLVVGGKAGLFVTDGTNPIADVTADVIDLDPVGLFPQGVFSPQGLQSTGNEMLYIGNDGMRSFLAAFDSKNTTTNNKSEQIKSELINALQNTSAAAVQLVHYPRRNWVMMKIGDVIYNYNYTPIFTNGKYNPVGTFTKFTGLLAQQTAFLVTRAGDLITADATGRVYTFDVSGVFTDNGTNIQTTYTSPWHTLQEAESNADIIIKDGRYVRPVIETSATIEYTMSVIGDYSQLSQSSIVFSSEGNGITNPKLPLRWRGKQAQFTITTDTSVGVDILSSYTIYGNIFGRK